MCNNNSNNNNPTKLDNRMSEKYKISDKVINFITKAIENWKLKLASGQILTLVKSKKSLSLSLSLSFSPLLLVIVMIPLNYILRKCTEGDKFIKLWEKINQLMYMDDICQK